MLLNEADKHTVWKKQARKLWQLMCLLCIYCRSTPHICVQLITFALTRASLHWSHQHASPVLISVALRRCCKNNNLHPRKDGTRPLHVVFGGNAPSLIGFNSVPAAMGLTKPLLIYIENRVTPSMISSYSQNSLLVRLSRTFHISHLILNSIAVLTLSYICYSFVNYLATICYLFLYDFVSVISSFLSLFVMNLYLRHSHTNVYSIFCLRSFTLVPSNVVAPRRAGLPLEERAGQRVGRKHTRWPPRWTADALNEKTTCKLRLHN